MTDITAARRVADLAAAQTKRDIELQRLAKITTAKHLGVHEPGSDGWNDVRRWRVGGSEVAAVLGLSPWESRLSLWLQKKGLVDPQGDDPLLEWGRRIEPAVREKFIEDHPGDWKSNPGMFHHADRSWQLANPDALSAAGELLEVKTALYPDGWGDDGTDEIPIYYRCQLLWYIDTLGLDGGWLAALIGGTDYRVYRIDRDVEADADIAILRDAGEGFIASLINNRQPDIDRHSATYQAMRELHPDIHPGFVEVDADLAGDYLAAVIAEKEAELDKKYYAAQILDELGSLRDARVDGARFAYRSHRSSNGQPGTPFLAADRTRLKQLTHPKTIREAS